MSRGHLRSSLRRIPHGGAVPRRTGGRPSGQIPGSPPGDRPVVGGVRLRRCGSGRPGGAAGTSDGWRGRRSQTHRCLRRPGHRGQPERGSRPGLHPTTDRPHRGFPPG